jgi:hypothetical protein
MYVGNITGGGAWKMHENKSRYQIELDYVRIT